jgi:hypothetical protein
VITQRVISTSEYVLEAGDGSPSRRQPPTGVHTACPPLRLSDPHSTFQPAPILIEKKGECLSPFLSFSA